MKKLLLTLLLTITTYSIYAQKISVDTYNNGIRRILTKGVKFTDGCQVMLDVYANKTDTVYYIKIGLADKSDSIIVNNRFLIKVAGRKVVVGTEINSVGIEEKIYKQVSEDSIITLTCSQATDRSQSTSEISIPIGTTVTTYPITHSYQVAFYKISKYELEKIINQGVCRVRIETINNLIDKKATSLTSILASQYKSVQKRLKEPNPKENIADF